MKVKKIINGILAIVLTGCILLISDSNNRIKKEQANVIPDKASLKEVNKFGKKPYKFSFTHYVDSQNSEECEKGLREEFERQGYREGIDYTLKEFNSQGDVSTLNSIAETIAADKWDIVFASSTPTLQVFFKKIKNSPIVFTNVGDPVRSGIGESFTNHPPNVTGVSTLSDFPGLVNFIVETMPGIKKIGTVYTPGEINSVIYTDELRLAAEKEGLTLISVPASSVSEVSDAARSMSSRGVQAFAQISDNLTGSCSSTIIKESYNSGIPFFAFVTDQTKQGAVASVARDYYEAGADAARKAIKILNGVSPGDIPFEFVKKTKITINKKAMEAFDIEIPKKYLTPDFLMDSEDDTSVNK
ncbi:MAG: ABC transporter substrate-binding protein [Prolixibacteraceae bacterium]|nr:ABC transporter substrate-binding protein [Prolixibacteraceae bacterium]